CDWSADVCSSDLSMAARGAQQGTGATTQEPSVPPAPGKAMEQETLAELPGKVTNWCDRFGLLGLLPMRTLSVTLARTLKQVPDWGPRKVSVVLRHVRTATGWMDLIEFTRRLRRPSAFIKGIEGWREEPLTETWAKYFPSIPAEKQRKFQYP